MNLPSIDIECNIEIIENKNSEYEIIRPLIFIPVEGYNWISRQIAYYKSSSKSNALTDSLFKSRVRKFMWFPTIGILSENTFMSNLLKNNPQEYYKAGYILKYINSVFKDQLCIKYFYAKGYDVMPEYRMVDPYLMFINFENVLEKIQNKTRFTSDQAVRAVAKINEFREFLGVMLNYCYNWKQIQDSIRLSVKNTIDGQTLMESEFGPMCSFILQHYLVNEFDKDINKITLEQLSSDRELPVFKVNYESKNVSLKTDNDIDINKFLLLNGAINAELMINPYYPSQENNSEDLRNEVRPWYNKVNFPADFIPFYDTMYLGKSFPIRETPVALPVASVNMRSPNRVSGRVHKFIRTNSRPSRRNNSKTKSKNVSSSRKKSKKY